MKILNLANIEVIESSYLTKPKEVNRTWKERLTSWPWRPFTKTKIIQIPSDKILVYDSLEFGGKKILAHPAIAKQVREAIKLQFKF